jgi:hypothetical protein
VSTGFHEGLAFWPCTENNNAFKPLLRSRSTISRACSPFHRSYASSSFARLTRWLWRRFSMDSGESSRCEAMRPSKADKERLWWKILILHVRIAMPRGERQWRPRCMKRILLVIYGSSSARPTNCLCIQRGVIITSLKLACDFCNQDGEGSSRILLLDEAEIYP